MTQASSNHPFLSFMLNAVLAALQPRDAIEAALAARAVVAHHAAMECFRRAALAEVSDLLMGRLFAKAMALSQRRNKN